MHQPPQSTLDDTELRLRRLSPGDDLTSPDDLEAASHLAWETLRVITFPSGTKAPMQLVCSTIDLLTSLGIYDDQALDALVRLCRRDEDDPSFYFGSVNTPHYLEWFCLIDRDWKPTPLVKDVILACVKGDERTGYVAEWPTSEPAWKER